jgi:hypothetical protein
MVELPFPAVRPPVPSPVEAVPLAEVVPDASAPWPEAVGQDDAALPVHVRWDPLAAAIAPVHGFDIQVAVAVPLVVAGTDGLPTPADELRLRDIEDLVREGMEREERARLVLVVTTPGVREYVGYCDDEAWIAQWAAQIARDVPGAQVMSRRDPSWTALLYSIP